MNLVYSCVFVSKKYIEIFKNLVTSFSENKNENTCYLVITQKEFYNEIDNICIRLNINYDIWIIPVSNDYYIEDKLIESIYDACSSRYLIYNYKHIHKYNKILYLDCDILCFNDINNVFNIEIENNKFYYMSEPANRRTHFDILTDDEYDKCDKTKAFSTAVIYFLNTEENKRNMISINEYINNYRTQNVIPTCFDQPIVIKYCIEHDIMNNTQLKGVCDSVLFNEGMEKIAKLKHISVCHFATNPGDYENKLKRQEVTNKIREMYF